MSPDRSNLPILLLTRPGAGSARVLADCEAALGRAVTAEISPVLQIVPIGDPPDLIDYSAVLLTSAYAVRGDLAGKDAVCVGERTAHAAKAAGAQVALVVPDAASLMAQLPQLPTPTLYLRGAHVASDLAAHYGCDEHVVYDQRACPLSGAAKRVVEGEQPVILPLFSPRSARLIAKEVPDARSDLHVIAMSSAVADAWRGARRHSGKVDICDAPTQVMMVSRIVASLRNT